MPRCLLPALILAVLGLIAGPGPAAWAHAVLLESKPADGASVDAAPPAVELRFNEPVRPVAVQVLDTAGAPVAGPGAVSSADATVRIALPPELEPGRYIVSYRVTSADGHPVTGSLVFGIGATAAPRPAAALDPGALPVASAANRAVHYGALLAAVGGIFFVLLVLGRPHPLEGRLRGGLYGWLALAAATSALSVGLSGVQLTGMTMASLGTAAPWAAGLGTSLGGSAALAVGGLLIMAAGLAARPSQAGTAALLLGGLLAASSLALTGHAATAPPRAVSAPAVYLHGLAAAFWAGSLWPLAVALRTMPAQEAHPVVQRFSRLAVGAVAMLLAAGVVLSLVQIDRPAAILTTGYGRLWLAKVGLAALLLGLAAVNRRILTPRLTRSAPHPATGLRRSIATELVLVACILGVTALLGQTPPPRAIDAAGHPDHTHEEMLGHMHAPSAGHRIAVSERGYTALLETRPAVPGNNQLVVTLTDPKGWPLAARDVSVALSLPAAGIEPLERTLATMGNGRFASAIEIPLPGRWNVRIDALVTDFEKLIFRTETEIR